MISVAFLLIVFNVFRKSRSETERELDKILLESESSTNVFVKRVIFEKDEKELDAVSRQFLIASLKSVHRRKYDIRLKMVCVGYIEFERKGEQPALIGVFQGNICDFRDYAFVCDVPERLIPYTDPHLLGVDKEILDKQMSSGGLTPPGRKGR